MVRFFAAGLFVGFPLGCYLREQGYHKRIQAAYKVLKPGDDEPQMNKHRDTTNDFYKDLQQGRAEHIDFERHIYGQYGGKSYHRDKKDDEYDLSQKEKIRIENEFKDYIDKEQAKALKNQ